MKNRVVASLNVLLLLTASLLAAASGARATAAPPANGEEAAATTEDILYMNDGRELHGRIIEERPDAIVFELTVRGTSIRTNVTYLRDDIAEIDRDVAITDAPEKSGSKPHSRLATADKDQKKTETTYGARRFAATDENVPSFYIVPMRGQMGTDVNTDVYRDMVDDIRTNDPDMLIIEMKCYDRDHLLMSMVGSEETGIADIHVFDEYRKLINLFRDELGDIRQVLWVQDSLGVSSVVAMIWPELYMSPDARFGGLEVVPDQIGFEKWSDEDVRGKMTAAFMSWVKGFLEYGGYPLVLADAMVRPKYALSGTWKGREVIWSLDTKGEYIVDQDKKRTAQFTAKTAEDLSISDGTVDNLDDLSLLLGIREYRVLEGQGERIFDKYVESWRRARDNCETWLKDYQQYLGWASGDDELKYLGKAKGRLEKVVAAMNRYNAVETRLRLELGVKKFDLITQIETLKARIRSIRQAGRGGGGRGLGGGGLGGGG